MKYRDRLPQLEGDLFLTDGGIETVLIFHEGIDLPAFAAFDLLKDEEGTERLRSYYAPYVALARERRVGFVLESPTWRASPRWAGELGYRRWPSLSSDSSDAPLRSGRSSTPWTSWVTGEAAPSSLLGNRV
jgi:hypothetical protein